MEGNKQQPRDILESSFESMDMINYRELYKIPAIQDFLLENVLYGNTLEFYTFYNGNLYKFYQLHRENLIELTPIMELKLIQLSLISLVRALKLKTIPYDMLIEEFEIQYDLQLEKLLISVSSTDVLRVKMDSKTREVSIIDLHMRNICNNTDKLQFLSSDQVVTKLDLKQDLTKFQQGKLQSAVLKLWYNPRYENENVLNKLIKLNLLELNKIAGIHKTKQDEINSRKRKVGE